METYTVKIDEYKTIRWYQNDKLHRTGGPAIEYADGEKCWYQNGKLHRLDGPAIEYANGTKCWYLNGKQLSEAEFNKKSKVPTCAGKVVTVDEKKYTLTEAA